MEPELVTDWLIAALCDCGKDRVRRRPPAGPTAGQRVQSLFASPR